VIEVQAVYHRNEPIIFGAPPTRPIGGFWFTTLGNESAGIKRRLAKAGIPGIQRIYSLASPNMHAVSLKQMHPGHVDEVIKALSPGGDQYSGHHIWILVDDDVDVSNADELHWAIASRCAPETGVKVIPSRAVWQLDPRIPPGDRSDPDAEHGRKYYTAHNLVINACRPYEWLADFPPVNVNSPELRQRIQRRWKDVLDTI
jgi:4-hydroxy-3-polyprenylbenzoate decarboxylase